MKEYIRTTHNFNNETREWEFRGDKGNDKHGIWDYKNNDEKLKLLRKETGHLYSMGVHALERNYWMTIDQIVTETIKMYRGGAVDWSIEKEFIKFVAENENYKEIIKSDILKELEYLIELDEVRVREKI